MGQKIYFKTIYARQTRDIAVPMLNDDDNSNDQRKDDNDETRAFRTITMMRKLKQQVRNKELCSIGTLALLVLLVLLASFALLAFLLLFALHCFCFLLPLGIEMIHKLLVPHFLIDTMLEFQL